MSWKRKFANYQPARKHRASGQSEMFKKSFTAERKNAEKELAVAKSWEIIEKSVHKWKWCKIHRRRKHKYY